MYEWIKATIECGELIVTYQIEGESKPRSSPHDDEIASDYTDDEIRDLTVVMLDVPDGQRDMIEVIWN